MHKLNIWLWRLEEYKTTFWFIRLINPVVICLRATLPHIQFNHHHHYFHYFHYGHICHLCRRLSNVSICCKHNEWQKVKVKTIRLPASFRHKLNHLESLLWTASLNLSAMVFSSLLITIGAMVCTIHFLKQRN